MTDSNKIEESQQSDPYVPDGAVSDPRLDRFRRWPFAQRIAQTIAARTDPSCIVIGVYGAWGEGKTTVLNFIQHELRDSPTIVPVKFNPWRFGDEATLLRSFFKTLADALRKSLSTKVEAVGEWLEQYGSILTPISLTLGGIVDVSPGESIKQFGKALSSVELDALKGRIEKFLGDAKTRVVILMDDIDRLDKTEINNVFKLIKLTADFSYTAYVLAFDNRMVAAALREKYVAAESDAGESFLDKIIQVPLHLPKADTIALRKLCFEGVDQAVRTSSISLTQEQVDRFVNHFIQGLEIRLQTPRIAKRYSNALSFALPILKDEVDSIDLMLIEGIRVFYPKLYTTIRENRELFLGSSSDYLHRNDDAEKNKQAILPSALAGLTTKESEAAKSLLSELFPRFGRMRYGSDWEEQWAKQKRLTSKYYFDRFFSYAVPEGDVSDAAIEDFLTQLPKHDLQDIQTSISQLMTSRNADNFVLKLRGHENDLPAEESKKLGTAVSLLGELFPNPETLFSPTTPFSQAAILVARLAKNIPVGNERVSYVEKIVLEGKPLAFSIEIMRWLRSGKDTPEVDRKLTEEEENALSRRLAERIKTVANEGPTYILHPKDSVAMLSIWAHWLSRDETSKYLSDSFSENSQNVLAFLKAYLPTAWGMDSGLPHKGEFMREQYDSIERVVDPEVVLSHLRSVFGEEIDHATFDTSRFESPDKATAFRFASMYSQRQTRKGNCDFAASCTTQGI